MVVFNANETWDLDDDPISYTWTSSIDGDLHLSCTQGVASGDNKSYLVANDDQVPTSAGCLSDGIHDITLEVCPGSNFALGLYENSGDHPLNKLRAAGVNVTLGSDDPPFFGTTIGTEYKRAQRDFGLSVGDLLNITATAIDAAFVDNGTKCLLRARL